MKIIRVIAFANGTPCSIAGQWLESFDHEAHNGRGYGCFTRDKRAAMQFCDEVEALEFWSRRSRRHPIRLHDLKPNRPLTACTVEIEDA